jgi:AcrR family transcriptional regulator
MLGSVKRKVKRRYDSARRRRAAVQRRAAVVAAARRLFLRDGFAATTIAAIAADAGVSQETVYKTFGTKMALVRAVREQALAGEGSVDAERRSDRMQAAEKDPRAIIRAWSALLTEVAPQVSPVLLLVRDAAAADPGMARLQAELDASRLTRMTRNARTLHSRGHLRPGITLAAAADVLWACSSPELYELLVIRRRWPIGRYGRFVADAMIASLL